MRVLFRQGLVKTPGGFISIGAGSASLVLPPDEALYATIADGSSNYLITEKLSVPSAWKNLPTGQNRWLYIDLDVKTGERTFGSTALEPIEGATAPLTPANDQHWFDTTTFQMKVYSTAGAKWTRVVRVFVVKLQGGSVPVSMSINAPAYTGTQVGSVSAAPIDAGGLIFDADGFVIKRYNGEFFTTESPALSSLASSSQIKVGNITLRATAEVNIPSHTLVKFTAFETITTAGTFIPRDGVYGFVENDVARGNDVEVILEGVVTNPAWDWASAGVNAFVYVNMSGQPTTTISMSDEPIGVVVGRHSILLRPSTLFGLQADTFTGGVAVAVQNEGSNLTSSVNVLNFTGSGIEATVSGNNVTIDVSADTTYVRANPTTAALGGIAEGMTFNGTLQDVLDTLLYPYIQPTFSSFTFGQPSPIEVGSSIPGTMKNFVWATTTSSNVAPNTITITDVTTASTIVSNTANDGAHSQITPAVTKTAASTHTWRIAGQDTQAGSFTRDLTVEWQWRRFHGESTNTSLTGAQVLALRASGLSSTATGEYNMLTGGYKYIAYPTAFGLKSIFKDTSTNLEVAMIPATTVSVTNAYGVTQDYYVHRTLNQLGGAITIAVS